MIDREIDVILEYSQAREVTLILNADEWYPKKIFDGSGTKTFEIEFWITDIESNIEAGDKCWFAK